MVGASKGVHYLNNLITDWQSKLRYVIGLLIILHFFKFCNIWFPKIPKIFLCFIHFLLLFCRHLIYLYIIIIWNIYLYFLNYYFPCVVCSSNLRLFAKTLSGKSGHQKGAGNSCVIVGYMYFFLRTLQVNNGVWELGDALCDTYVALDVMCCTASILNLAAISVDR